MPTIALSPDLVKATTDFRGVPFGTSCLVRRLLLARENYLYLMQTGDSPLQTNLHNTEAQLACHTKLL